MKNLNASVAYVQPLTLLTYKLLNRGVLKHIWAMPLTLNKARSKTYFSFLAGITWKQMTLDSIWFFSCQPNSVNKEASFVLIEYSVISEAAAGGVL